MERKFNWVRLIRWSRRALLAAIALTGGLILTTPRDESSGYPQFMSRAQADAVAAAPGYLLTSIPANGNDKFYLLDNDRQWLGCYGLNTDQLRLYGARRFDYDVDLLEGASVFANQRVKIENAGNPGPSREDIKGLGKKQQDEINKKQKP